MTSTRVTSSTRAWEGVVLGCLLALVLASPASAHPRYKTSNPASGAEVSSPPGEVYVEFTEPITAGSSMKITDPCGRAVATGDAQVTATSMTQAMAGSAAGTYSVYWRALGADGHPTEGEFSFSSSGGDPCPGEEPASAGRSGGGEADNEPESDGSAPSSQESSSSVETSEEGAAAGETGGGAGKGSGEQRSAGPNADGARESKARGGGSPNAVAQGGPGNEPLAVRAPELTTTSLLIVGVTTALVAVVIALLFGLVFRRRSSS